ncbi:tumor protein p53-inducible protein 13 [Trichomycterus rosablanca]|uniref:tumor protein p53-inducible protein 13 n=1 Tax=Trichomycterus rosablanca TaxID=2290929 RepID=UPI002F34F1B6
MRFPAETSLYVLRSLLWIFLISSVHSELDEDCDNGKAKLEIDLPKSDELVCSDSKSLSTERLPDVSITYPLQPTHQVCMDTPIIYNHTIPNSGAHRPVGAQNGEYWYCPPQRWINNLKDGAVVLLFHPCAPEEARMSLAMMAHSCLSHFILTVHPQLSTDRPYALVSWGRTLEMSHITAAGVCEWLHTAFSSVNLITENKRHNYSLYMTKAVLVDRALRTTVKSVRMCCLEALSRYKRTARARKRRAALRPPKTEVKGQDERSEKPALRTSDSIKLDPTNTKLLNISKDNSLPSVGSHDPNPVKHDEGGVEMHERTSEKRNHPSGGKTEQDKEFSKPHLQMDVKSNQSSEKHHIRTDTKEQSTEEGCGGHCGPPEVVLEGSLRGRKMPVPRTDEAVWAAVALGFLLVLLTLSILHTRLYRHWRAPASLYWQENQQDYESVADIIRRRLKMVGRRKRRASKIRRKECLLLPNTSTDNDSD